MQKTEIQFVGRLNGTVCRENKYSGELKGSLGSERMKRNGLLG